MARDALARRISLIATVRGHFRLRSGQTATEYFDKYLFESQPELLREIARQMVSLIPDGTDALAGLELGGIPIATMLSQLSGIPTLFVRKAAKKYGTCKLAEGGEARGRALVIVEDVVTTGGQVINSANDLRNLEPKMINSSIALVEYD